MVHWALFAVRPLRSLAYALVIGFAVWTAYQNMLESPITPWLWAAITFGVPAMAVSGLLSRWVRQDMVEGDPHTVRVAADQTTLRIETPGVSVAVPIDSVTFIGGKKVALLVDEKNRRLATIPVGQDSAAFIRFCRARSMEPGSS